MFRHHSRSHRRKNRSPSCNASHHALNRHELMRLALPHHQVDVVSDPEADADDDLGHGQLADPSHGNPNPVDGGKQQVDADAEMESMARELPAAPPNSSGVNLSLSDAGPTSAHYHPSTNQVNQPPPVHPHNADPPPVPPPPPATATVNKPVGSLQRTMSNTSQPALIRSASPPKPADALVSTASASRCSTPSNASTLTRSKTDLSPSHSRHKPLISPRPVASGSSGFDASGLRGPSDESNPASPNEDSQFSQGLRDALSTALSASDSSGTRLAIPQHLTKTSEEPSPIGALKLSAPSVDSLEQQITGFAVASSKRNAEFHSLFPEVPQDDYLIDDYGCALVRDLMHHGRLYISEDHLCFSSNIFGWVTNMALPFEEISAIDKRMTALVIPNAIQVTMINGTRHTFASFLSRDATYDVMVNIWRLSHPSLASKDDDNSEEEEAEPTWEGRSKARMSKRARLRRRFLERKEKWRCHSEHLDNKSDGEEEEEEEEDDDDDEGDESVSSDQKTGTTEKAKKKRPHAPTEAEGEHFANVVLDTTYACSVETLYNLLFTTDFVREFLVNDQQLLEVDVGDWSPDLSNDRKLQRSVSYIKPLNASIGPKQTKCVIEEVTDHMDPEGYTSTYTTTRTPDVPSGGSFAVKTRTCLTWAGGWHTRLHVTCTVEWTGRSFIRSVIDCAAIDGQKEYYKALDGAVTTYMQEHANEFKDATEPDPSSDEAVAGTNAVATASPKQRSPANSVTKPVPQLPPDNGLWSYVSPIWGGAQDVVGTGLDSISQMPLSTLLLSGAVLVLLVLNVWAMTTTRGTPVRSSTPRPSMQDEALLGQALRQALQQALEPLVLQGMQSAGPQAFGSVPGTDPSLRSEVERLSSLLQRQIQEVEALKASLIHLADRTEATL